MKTEVKEITINGVDYTMDELLKLIKDKDLEIKHLKKELANISFSM